MSGAGARLQRILAELGQPLLAEPQQAAFETYLELLLRWNGRVNLTAIREEDGVLRRHFAESIFCARQIPAGVETLLDFGSGGGFPGVPCAICRPEISVTLAESQGKKAAFLAEVVRTLGLQTEVFAHRVEEMQPDRLFGVVTLRAVDKMEQACRTALLRTREGGWLGVMSTREQVRELAPALGGVAWRPLQQLPGSEQQVLLWGRRVRV